MFLRRIRSILWFAVAFAAISSSSLRAEDTIEKSLLEEGPSPTMVVLGTELLELQTRIKKLPELLEGSKAIEEAQVLFFLEEHVKTWLQLGLDCKTKEANLRDALERSVPRDANPDRLEPEFRGKLKAILQRICH